MKILQKDNRLYKGYCFKEVLSISEDINDLKNQAMTYGNQGITYKNIKEFDLALKNYNKQLEISQKINAPFRKVYEYMMRMYKEKLLKEKNFAQVTGQKDSIIQLRVMTKMGEQSLIHLLI